MARALWKGAVSFGLVYIPVQLHAASRDSALKMHMLDRRDFAPEESREPRRGAVRR